MLFDKSTEMSRLLRPCYRLKNKKKRKETSVNKLTVKGDFGVVRGTEKYRKGEGFQSRCIF